MKKKKKQAVILLGVLAILLAALFTLRTVNRRTEETETKKAAEQKIYVTDISDMTKIRYQSGTDGMGFEKAADQETWISMEDPDFPLAQQYPEEMKNTFEKLEVKRELKDGDELSAYGLDEPQYQVTLTDRDGTETTLYFGNAVDDGYYLTVDDAKTVYTVGNVIDVFQHSLEEMAQLDEYPNIGSGNLKKETITQNGGTTTYDSENEDDAEAIAAVAGGLGAVKLSSAADYSVADADLAKYSLDETARITVEAVYTENDKENVQRLYIGGDDGSGNRYVMMNDSRIVYLISGEICDNILNVGEEQQN